MIIPHLPPVLSALLLCVGLLLGGCSTAPKTVQDAAEPRPAEDENGSSLHPPEDLRLEDAPLVEQTRSGTKTAIPHLRDGRKHRPAPLHQDGHAHMYRGVAYAPSGSFRQRGIASWYGKAFHGRPTACGEPFDMHGDTAAHRTLPMHAKVLVRNLDNGRSTVVRINDRGPFRGGRIIDLSYAKARELGFVHKGRARVELVALTPVHSVKTTTVEGKRRAAETVPRLTPAWSKLRPK